MSVLLAPDLESPSVARVTSRSGRGGKTNGRPVARMSDKRMAALIGISLALDWLENAHFSISMMTIPFHTAREFFLRLNNISTTSCKCRIISRVCAEYLYAMSDAHHAVVYLHLGP